jgi:hypothetical protein
MNKLFENPRALAELADKPTESIAVEGIIIMNPNDSDAWIAAAINKDEKKKARVYQEGLLFAHSLPTDSRSDFLNRLYRSIKEDYLSVTLFLKKTITYLPRNKVEPFVAYLRSEQDRKIVTDAMVLELIESITVDRKNIDVEDPIVSEPIGLESQGLDNETVKNISNQAAWRKREIDEIDELKAFTDINADGGFMFAMAQQGKNDLPRLLHEYKIKYQEDFPGGEELLITLSQFPQDIGLRFDAHGIGKGNFFENLINLLNNGVDLKRSFHTMPLVYEPDLFALGAASPYTEGGIIVVGPPNEKDSKDRKLIVDREAGVSNIKYVVLDRQYYFAIPQLQQVYPNVTFVRSSDMNEFFTQEVAKVDSEK